MALQAVFPPSASVSSLLPLGGGAGLKELSSQSDQHRLSDNRPEQALCKTCLNTAGDRPSPPMARVRPRYMSLPRNWGTDGIRPQCP